MTLRNWHAVRILEFAGGKHANFHLPLFEPARFVLADAQAARAFLLRLASETGADTIIIRNQPLAWRGVANSLALSANLASSDAGYRGDLSSDPEAYFRAVMSGETRKKLRKKRRLLAALGDVNFLKAATLAETDTILAAFHRQKADRLTKKSLANPFEAPGAARFLRHGGTPPKPAIQLFALRADARIVATFGGTCDGRNFCGMFNSFDSDPMISRSSPGELLLEDLLTHLCRAGYQSFDLGTGDAPYKHTYCPDRMALVDTVIGATPAGRLFAGAMQISGRTKAFVKRHPTLMHLAGSAQRLAQRKSQDAA
jgi:CelD/BcsL family acetyltransferase involved in cellulose biosynthesis